MSYLGCCPCACTQQTETVFGIRVCGRYTIQSMDSAAIRLRVYRANAHDTFFFVFGDRVESVECVCVGRMRPICVYECACVTLVLLIRVSSSLCGNGGDG